MPTQQELETYLHQQIPLTKAMGVRVMAVDDQGAKLAAPLANNRNHLGTGFGGSLQALMILSCYTWIFYEIKKRGHDGHIVIKSSDCKYLQPVEADLVAICTAPPAAELEKFLRAFAQKSKARLNLRAHIPAAHGEACWLSGEFVALGEP